MNPTNPREALRADLKSICYAIADDLLRGGSVKTGNDYADQILSKLDTYILEGVGADDVTEARNGGYRTYIRDTRNHLRHQILKNFGLEDR